MVLDHDGERKRALHLHRQFRIVESRCDGAEVSAQVLPAAVSVILKVSSYSLRLATST
jgi:hypothetical protein